MSNEERRATLNRILMDLEACDKELEMLATGKDFVGLASDYLTTAICELRKDLQCSSSNDR